MLTSRLNSLGMAEPFRNRIRDVVEWFAALAGEPLVEMFISDYLEQNGERRFGTVVLFGATTLLEVQNLEVSPPIWITSTAPSFTIVEMHHTDYNFMQAKAGSRLSGMCMWPGRDFGLDLKASGENCDRLKRLIMERRAK
jgi:hypothetical protein